MAGSSEEREEAVFGAFDGVVSVIGFVFGLLIHNSPKSAIAIGGLGGAISATISMGTGCYESSEGPVRSRLRKAIAMSASTLIGSLMPIWPFFVFSKTIALIVGGIGCLLVASWIGWEKHAGMRGYASAYLTLVGASGLTLLIIGFIPASAGG